MRVLDENEVNMLCCGDDGDVEALDGSTDAEHRVTQNTSRARHCSRYTSMFSHAPSLFLGMNLFINSGNAVPDIRGHLICWFVTQFP